MGIWIDVLECKVNWDTINEIKSARLIPNTHNIAYFRRGFLFQTKMKNMELLCRNISIFIHFV